MIEPRSGLSSPTRVLSSTDLPVPDGPSITEISPAGSVSETSCQITCRPKDLVSPSTWISTPTPHLADRLPTGNDRAAQRSRDRPGAGGGSVRWAGPAAHRESARGAPPRNLLARAGACPETQRG